MWPLAELDELRTKLAAAAAKASRRPHVIGSAKVIVRDSETGTWMGGADPRREAYALAANFNSRTRSQRSSGNRRLD